MPTAIVPRLFTVSECAELLGVHPCSVRELIRDGRIRSVRFGPHGWHRIPSEELERLLADPTLEVQQ